MTFAEFFTFFLIVAFIALPLHLAHSYVFRNVIEVSELHEEIERFPSDRTVREVGPDRLGDYRASLALVGVLELALLPLLVRATRKAMVDRSEGRVPTVLRAWSGVSTAGGGYFRALARKPGPLITALVVALILGFLGEKVGLLAAQPLGDRSAWLGVGLAQAAARALAAPFFLVTWAFAASEVKEEGSSTPKLY